VHDKDISLRLFGEGITLCRERRLPSFTFRLIKTATKGLKGERGQGACLH
jgi:hypothetical protein